MTGFPSMSDAEREIIAAQLGRRPRGLLGVAHRCPCGKPDVVATVPTLPDGTPFPTLFYLTCPRACAAVGRLESQGLMRAMTQRLAEDRGFAARYHAAAADYQRRRDAVGALPGHPLPGGLPDRVKCLHVALAHTLAAGDGVNPVGDQVRAEVGAWWRDGRCVEVA